MPNSKSDQADIVPTLVLPTTSTENAVYYTAIFRAQICTQLARMHFEQFL
jgi:hypothetical protein